jgi:hypothetical protein
MIAALARIVHTLCRVARVISGSVSGAGDSSGPTNGQIATTSSVTFCAAWVEHRAVQ